MGSKRSLRFVMSIIFIVFILIVLPAMALLINITANTSWHNNHPQNNDNTEALTRSLNTCLADIASLTSTLSSLTQNYTVCLQECSGPPVICT